jgi:ATP-dependent DNA helicase RecG
MRSDPKISAKSLGEKIGLTARGVEKNISQLKKSGSIKRMGSTKGGYWVVRESEE